jgi:hypothetical protein
LALFAERGARLWLELELAGRTADPAARVLAEEACRLADRLDRLDAILRGESREWVRVDSAEGLPVLVVDKALGEARQQAVALKTILAELRQREAHAPAAPMGSAVDELAQKRADRLASSAH